MILNIEVDLFDRLPTPYGLVRGGVAPDHQKIKSVTKVYEKIAQISKVRFFGYVDYGSDITMDALKDHYHQVVFATGTQAGKMLNIPGADLVGNHAASDFVAWYNGHPDYRSLDFDLSQTRAAIIGMGNVAIDIARILCLTPDELHNSDIADYAMEALNLGNIKEISILGRRGPAQAAFTPPEIKELGALADADVLVLPEEAQLDALSQADLTKRKDRRTMQKVRMVQEFGSNTPTGKSRQLKIRFMVSPVEIKADERGKVASIRVVKNELYETEAGTLRPRPSDHFEDIPVGLVFHSIGYKGVPLLGIPFDERWGVIQNKRGRIVDPDKNIPLPGLYTSGWIKRGPSGVIGTNKLDANETVDCMIADLEKGIMLRPKFPEAAAAEKMVRQNQPKYILFKDWKHLDKIELERGDMQNRPRVKFTKINEMLGSVESISGRWKLKKGVRVRINTFLNHPIYGEPEVFQQQSCLYPALPEQPMKPARPAYLKPTSQFCSQPSPQ